MRAFVSLLAFGLMAIVAMPQPAHANRIRRMAKFLNLSDAQVAKIKSITYAARRTQIGIRAKLQLARLDLQQLLSQHRPDLKTVSAAIDKVGGFQLSLRKSRVMMMLKIKALLSKQQAEKMQAFNRRRKLRRRRLRKRFRRWRKQRIHRQRQRRRQLQGDDNPPSVPTPPTPSKKDND